MSDMKELPTGRMNAFGSHQAEYVKYTIHAGTIKFITKKVIYTFGVYLLFLKKRIIK